VFHINHLENRLSPYAIFLKNVSLELLVQIEEVFVFLPVQTINSCLIRLVDVHTTTTTESTNDYVWPPAVTTQSTGNKEQTKIIAWWNKMWYGKPAIGVN